MSDGTFAARGGLYCNNDLLGEWGRFAVGAQAVVLTASYTRNQVIGWPTWYYRYTDPIDEPFQGTLGDLTGGSALIYSTSPVTIHPLPGPFTLGAQGHLVEISSEFRGTFEDFFMQPYTNGGDLTEDPVNGFPVFGTAASSGVGAVGSAWNQHYLHFYPPKNARYLVPYVTTGSIANGKSLYMDAFQLEAKKTYSSAAPTVGYQSPRALNIYVVPTRKNHSYNPSFENSTSGLAQDAGISMGIDPAYAWKGGKSLKVTVANTVVVGSKIRETNFIDVNEGEPFAYSLRSYVPATLSGRYHLGVNFYTEDLQIVQIVLAMDNFIKYQTENDTGWDVNYLLTQVPAGATKAQVRPVKVNQIPSTTDVFYIDAVLIEKSRVIGDYFDGGFGTSYLWKQGDTAGSTQSYYYEDRVKRSYIMKQVLSENVPLGVSIVDPLYATV